MELVLRKYNSYSVTCMRFQCKSYLFFNIHNRQRTHIVQNVISPWAKIHLIKKQKATTSEVSALHIYKTMLLPYFDYADVKFHKANMKDVEKLQKLQNKCLRICMGRDRRFDTNRAHKIANVPFQNDRRKAHCNFMYKRKNNKTEQERDKN